MVRNAIIIGGGIAGLAAAAVLGRSGVSVTVLEQASKLREVGAGLQVSPNGMFVLRALGLEAALQERGAVKAQAVSLRDYKKTGEVARLDLTRLGADQRYYFVHRADLLDVLQRAARQAGADIRLNVRVTDVVPADLPMVRLDDGTDLRAELVIAADGVHSRGRAALNPQSSAFFTKQVAWRAVVPNTWAIPAEARVFMGPGRHIVSYPIRGGDHVNIVAVEEREAWQDEGWNHAGDPDYLRGAFAGFEGPAQDLLSKVTDVSVWGLFRHPVAPVWQRGGVVLIGDAAHPTLPFLAQGANMALEDAWVLGRNVQNLAKFQTERFARVSKIIQTAQGNAARYHLQPGVKRWVAHRGLNLVSRCAPRVMLGAFDWLYKHDVTQAT